MESKIQTMLQVHLKHIHAASLSNGFQQVKPGTVTICSAVQCRLYGLSSVVRAEKTD